MKIIIVEGTDKLDAAAECRELYGFYPEVVIEIDSDEEERKAFACFETAHLAVAWSDPQ